MTDFWLKKTKLTAIFLFKPILGFTLDVSIGSVDSMSIWYSRKKQKTKKKNSHYLLMNLIEKTVFPYVWFSWSHHKLGIKKKTCQEENLLLIFNFSDLCELKVIDYGFIDSHGRCDWRFLSCSFADKHRSSRPFVRSPLELYLYNFYLSVWALPIELFAFSLLWSTFFSFGFIMAWLFLAAW